MLTCDRHYFSGGSARDNLIKPVDYQGYPLADYPDALEGRETLTEQYDTNGTAPTTLLRSVSFAWQTGATMGGLAVNPRLVTTTTTVEPGWGVPSRRASTRRRPPTSARPRSTTRWAGPTSSRARAAARGRPPTAGRTPPSTLWAGSRRSPPSPGRRSRRRRAIPRFARITPVVRAASRPPTRATP